MAGFCIKPEWFFTFVLNMIRDHSLFIAEEVQSILNEAKFTLYNAKVSMMNTFDLVHILSIITLSHVFSLLSSRMTLLERYSL